MYVIEHKQSNYCWVMMTPQYYSEKWVAEACITTVNKVRGLEDWELRVTEITEVEIPEGIGDAPKNFSLSVSEIPLGARHNDGHVHCFVIGQYPEHELDTKCCFCGMARYAR